MLLQKIELKGFLSHHGQRNDLGEIVPVEIDFRKSPLWLIYGPNGAGKSAVFDAITFALFKEHRGGRTNFERLINDKSEKAEINLEIELAGKQYLVQRTINRQSRTKVWGMVRQWDGQEWKAEPETTNAVEDWVTKNLRMSYQTFVSAVLLRQGESDAFLKSKPTERKDCLIELLDLEFYRRLGEAANTQKNVWSKNQDNHQKTLDKTPEVTEVEIKIQNELIIQLEDKVFQAREILDKKKFALNESKRAAELITQIVEKKAQQELDNEVLLEAAKIQTQVEQYHQLKIFLFQLESLWQTRQKLVLEQNEFLLVQSQLKSTQIDFSISINKVNEIKESIQNLENEISQLELELKDAISYEQNLSTQTKYLGQIINLEKLIKAEQDKILSYKAILSKKNEIKESFELYNKFNLVSPVIDQIKVIENYIKKSKKFLYEVDEEILNLKNKKIILDNSCEQLKNQSSQLESQVKEKQISLQDYLTKIKIASSKIIDEKILQIDSECPICGECLTNPNVKDRLSAKRQHWQKEIDTLLGKQQELEMQISSLSKQKEPIELELSKALESLTDLKVKIKFEEKQSNVYTLLADYEEALKDLQTKLNIVEVEEIAKKLKNSEKVLEDWQNLNEALSAINNTNKLIDAYKNQLDLLPVIDEEMRQNLSSNIDKTKQKIILLNDKKLELEKSLETLKPIFIEEQNKSNEIQNQLTLINYKSREIEKRQQQFTVEISDQENKLPVSFASHPAILDETTFLELKNKVNLLAEAEQKFQQLTIAQTRVHQLVGAINLLEEQLEKIPPEYRRELKEVEEEYYQFSDEVLNTENELDQAKRKLVELESQRKSYLELKTLRNKAEKEVIYYTKLATTFGKRGLQAKIIQIAQEKIKQHANSTLRRLSNGVWQVDLQENSQGTELEILARDLSQPGSPLRQFEYLSGGEKFRVAISIAIAIGQSISGGRSVDTLVIDEGFGALDEINRSLLVSELRRLSEEVLHGGRVIIVSHQEDVCWEFANRYHISKGMDGLIEIEHNWNR